MRVISLEGLEGRFAALLLGVAAVFAFLKRAAAAADECVAAKLCIAWDDMQVFLCRNCSIFQPSTPPTE